MNSRECTRGASRPPPTGVVILLQKTHTASVIPSQTVITHNRLFTLLRWGTYLPLVPHRQREPGVETWRVRDTSARRDSRPSSTQLASGESRQHCWEAACCHPILVRIDRHLIAVRDHDHRVRSTIPATSASFDRSICPPAAAYGLVIDLTAVSRTHRGRRSRALRNVARDAAPERASGVVFVCSELDIEPSCPRRPRHPRSGVETHEQAVPLVQLAA